MTLFTCVMAFAGNVGTLQELKNALAAGGDITLTANITSAEQLNITKATTIDGQGLYTLIGTAQEVIYVRTSSPVVFKNLTLFAKNDNGRGIAIEDEDLKTNITIDNVVINTKRRAVTYYAGSNGSSLTVKNSTFQYVRTGSGVTVSIDEFGNPSSDADYNTIVAGCDARGIALWEMKNFTLTVDNSTLQGFDYVINCGPGAGYGDNNYEGTKVIAKNSVFKGRCAYNVHVQNAEFEFTDCTVVGVNRFLGPSESFACFVFDGSSNNCKLTINGGSFASAVFPGNATVNENAREFFVTSRGSNNTIVVNNAQYTCPKEYGNAKGGLAEQIKVGGTLTINGGIYDCPTFMPGFSSTDGQGGSVGKIIINGGTFNTNVISSDMTDCDVYYGMEISGGTFNLDMSVVDPGNAENDLIADGYKQVTNANGTYSIIPETTEAQSTAVNDVNWNTAADWSTTSQAEEVVPDAETSVTIGNGTEDVSVVVADDGAADVYRVDLNDKVTLTVQDGGVLTVGKGGIVSHENAAVVVEEGGSLVLNGLIQGTENIVIEASEENSAVVLIAPDVNTYGDEHPVGTFRFTSKSYKNGSKVVHQRFGMPTYNTGIDVKYGTTSSAKTYITNWDYEADDWKHSGDVVEWTEIPSSGSLPLVTAGPFACYDLISNNAKGDEITYEFTGALMGNADGEMKFNRGFNPYANSYTAPIDIESFLNRIASEYAGTDIKPTIYLYKAQANDNYTWASIGQDEFEFGDAEFTEVAPMQAFMLYLGSSTPQIATIDYEGNVYDPFIAKLSSSPSNAPARRVATKKNYLSMTITDAEGVEYDRVKFIEDDRFSSAFDNGYDAVKFMKEDVAIYAAADEAQATVASDYVEGMNIGVKVAKSGVYTLTVKYNGLDYALIDTENNTIIELENGKTYNFFAEAGQNDARFQVIKVNKVPTAIDEVEDSQVMSTKFMKDGVLYIIKNGAVYNAQGQIVK